MNSEKRLGIKGSSGAEVPSFTTTVKIKSQIKKYFGTKAYGQTFFHKPSKDGSINALLRKHERHEEPLPPIPYCNSISRNISMRSL